MSLRWRWALGHALVAIMAVALVAVASGALTSRALRAEVDRTLRERVESLGRVPFRDVTGRLPPGGDEGRVIRSLLGFEIRVQVLDSAGDVVLTLGDEEALPVGDVDRRVARGDAPATLRTFQTGDTDTRMITAPLRSGAVQLARDLAASDLLMRTLSRRFLMVGLASAGIAAAAGWWMAGRAARPLEELTDTVERVARTQDLTAEVDPGGDDEVGRLSRGFATMLAALGESRSKQQRLVSDAGHELRTPLTGLRTNIEVLRRRPDLGPTEREELVSAALAEVEQLGDLVDELVDLATDARMSTEPEVITPLHDLARPVAQRYAGIHTRQIRMIGDGAEVSVRPTQFERALGNLLENAAKWSPADSIIEVTVEGRRLAVLDSGPGVADADLPHIFDRFYRADSARSAPGSGLGLAIVKQAVEANGGTVFARNRPGGGAEIGFELPGPRTDWGPSEDGAR